MSYVNGILTVPAFTATGNPGEFTIAGATYNNQGDNTGQGTSAIAVGFVLYVQASDVNSFLPIPGLAHRYEITAVTVVDAATVNLTVLWNEAGAMVDAPTNGADCIITSVSPGLKFGYSVDNGLYPTLAAGMVSGMLNADVENITDTLAVAGSGGGVSSVNGKNGAVMFTAGANVVLDTSGADIVISTSGTDEGTF